MEFDNDQISVNTEEVAEPQQTEEVQEVSVQSEVADPKPVQDAETNAKFAEQRRKQELEETRKQAERYQQDLNRVARMAGYDSHESFLQAVAQREEELRIEQEAAQRGLDVDTYKQHIAPVYSEVEQLRQTVQHLQTADLSRQVQRELSDLKKDPDFAKYEEKTIEQWKKNPAFETLQDAYDFVSYKDRMAAEKAKTEQEILARVTGRDERQVLPSTDKPNNVTLDIDNMSLAEIEALSQRARRGERIIL